jgi:crotonobetainyl-CoA:carnitine CoA-transferase CaiB-like acyl-CoA transferase
MSLPLEGIKICDLSQIMFGPCGTQVLGDYGADIIKVENPKSGDISRAIDRFAAAGTESANFMAMNRNKRSLAVDLKSSEGLAIVKKIARESDVFVHNFRPGVVERMGLSYDDLKADNEDLIYIEGSGFGSSGPLRGKGGMDFVVQALAGICDGNRDAEGRPQLFPVSGADFSAGMILVQGVLMALYHRERTGRGQKIAINLLDVYLLMQQQEVTQKLRSGQHFNPLVQDPMDIFATSDGHIAVLAVLRPNPVSAICEALEIDDITKTPEMATLTLQMANRKLYRAKIGEGFAKYSSVECERRLEAAGILSSIVLNLGEVLNHPQVEANGSLVTLDHPTEGPVRTMGSAMKSSEAPQIALSPPPLLGQHSAQVLAEYGFSAEEIAGLAAQRVISDNAVRRSDRPGEARSKSLSEA